MKCPEGRQMKGFVYEILGHEVTRETYQRVSRFLPGRFCRVRCPLAV
jgi:hypothetical protein